ncbi:MAG: hypothetical protein JRI57_09165 [Deltaproteobacteria bacterium]|nr:hypothetical protein [Deltaproteobacteria bacterium]MBW1953281.1 hypothetical protein [Deltaproteobacteria bacterium]MBW1987442.1 hypothetical protein [Deltaproteobacteria bacterium]MBW2135515.1 hypothetical protein [Deltaproteobacteria bacterium]
MTYQITLLRMMGIGLLTLGLLGATQVLAQSASTPDQALLYQRAVSLLDKAQQKLEGNFTAEAKALAKEANSLFSTLQNELSQELMQRKLSPAEMKQEAINKKLATDYYAQGDELMQSAQQKEALSRDLEKQGKEEASVQQLTEAKREYDLAHQMYVKSQIYNLRNQEIAFKFIKK